MIFQESILKNNKLCSIHQRTDRENQKCRGKLSKFTVKQNKVVKTRIRFLSGRSDILTEKEQRSIKQRPLLQRTTSEILGIFPIRKILSCAETIHMWSIQVEMK